MSDFDDMKEKFAGYGFTVSDEQCEKFERYFSLLEEYNAKFNLTAVVGREEVLEKHFCDSLFGMASVKGKVIDIGAGAGFPSIPLMIVKGGNYTLLDSLNKRVGFLNTAISELNLKGTAVHSRIEEAGRNRTYRGRFDTVVARAVADLPTLIEYAIPLLKEGGNLVAWKGSNLDAELERSKNAFGQLSATVVYRKEYKLFDGIARNIVVIKKIGETANAFPRMGNKPRTKPL